MSTNNESDKEYLSYSLKPTEYKSSQDKLLNQKQSNNSLSTTGALSAYASSISPEVPKQIFNSTNNMSSNQDFDLPQVTITEDVARPRPKTDNELGRGYSINRRGSNKRQNNTGEFNSEGRPPRRWASNASSRHINAHRKKSHLITSESKSTVGPWTVFSWMMTCCFPPFLLRWIGLPNKQVQQAWREKITLVSIIVLICAGLAFVTFLLQDLLCGPSSLNGVKVGQLKDKQVSINGNVYYMGNFIHKGVQINRIDYSGGFDLFNQSFTEVNANKMDLSLLFQPFTRQSKDSSCKGVLQVPNESVDKQEMFFPCTKVDPYSTAKIEGSISAPECHFNVRNSYKNTKTFQKIGDLYYDWKDVKDKSKKLIVYGGNVIDLSKLNFITDGGDELQLHPTLFEITADNSPYLGKDISYYLRNKNPEVGQCLIDLLRVGQIDTSTIGCITSSVIQYITLVVIVCLVLAKFFMAVVFSWIVSWRLGSLNEKTYRDKLRRFEEIEEWADHDNASSTDSSPSSDKEELNNFGQGYPLGQIGQMPAARSSAQFSGIPKHLTSPSSDLRNRTGPNFKVDQPQVDPDLGFILHHSIQLVTCYSEGLVGIRNTLDSLANTNYPNNRQLLFVVADGIVTGADNEQSTPDICLSLMKDFIIPPELVKAHSYVAIAEGSKRHNMAKVYAGYYHQTNKHSSGEDKESKNSKGFFHKRVPMVLVIKCGTPEEANLPKPGNRGKRDSQVILMSFLQKAVFDDRMTEMEYELFNAVWNVSGVTPDNYETVLMVDADTIIYPDSLTRMVACFSRDPKVMGLCGETRISNKSQSWVTAIQVFEYYISHHLSKAFESIFGGVTCLPGCFCMYRIKTPKGNGDWIPVICNPDILQQYSENVVTTLHQKNLLLLGEDRFLTTLMLRTFPKRKLIFVPQAVCKTVAPDTFSVLLSQRRRWINSTVHNLLELVITRDLCGTFCFSMQFVIFLELIGTVVLPAAIIFTIYLIVTTIKSAVNRESIAVIPLVILALILGLPAVLIVITTRKISYIGWMVCYLLALPIWNFVLPAYAFWHFDDFSWGQTRMVAGESKDGHGDSEGEFDSTNIVMKRWEEFEREKRRRTVAVFSQYGTQVSLPTTLQNDNSRFGGSRVNLLGANSNATNSRYTLNSNNSNGNGNNANRNSNLDNLGYMSPTALKRVSRAIVAEEEYANILTDNPNYSNPGLDDVNFVPASPLHPEPDTNNSMPWRSQNSFVPRNSSNLNMEFNRTSFQDDSNYTNGAGSQAHTRNSSMFDPTYTSNSNK